jgi:hypothetical protein
MENKNKSFRKGQFFNVRYTVMEGRGIRATSREVIGEYEIIRTGRRLYLFDNHVGIDWCPTKNELQEAIKNYSK